MTIKVGDKVNKVADTRDRPNEYEVLYIHSRDPRVYYVVAFMGDKPTVHKEGELQKVCDWVKFYSEGVCFKAIRKDGVIDFTTVRRCDDNNS